jgi:hypothetical protein
MIDYSILAGSISYYEHHGFSRIEAPRLVPDEILNITKPDGVHPHEVIKNGKKKNFVGSAEQSFLYLINKGFLLPGRYQAVTPCMRDDNFGLYHTKYFMKNELIYFGDVTVDAVQPLMKIAYNFFLEYTNNALVRPAKSPGSLNYHNRREAEEMLKIVRTTDDSWDIELCGVEIGSYGLRSCSFATWIYGTGVALPRLTRILKNIEKAK